jgi:hypothetical protein
MNPNPPKTYAEQMRDRRKELMRLPDVSPEQEADMQLAKTLQLEIMELDRKIGGTALIPRRPAGVREARRAELEAEKAAKVAELNKVVPRISFLT